ncbi:MAG TPA: glycine oxidase ThiO [Kiloniellaceae bacterium]|nr:glycine oxidase ThiO [Kiloniellaceae bacterium]
MAERQEITVVGGGVAGLCAAVALRERGHPVTVIERGLGPGRQACSWYAGGMLAPWCEGETAEEPVVRLGQEAIGWWADRVPGVERRGSLVLAAARDGPELDRFARRTAAQPGVHHLLNDGGIAALEPALAGRFTRALYFPQEAHLDPRAALAALSRRFCGLGGIIRYRREADHVPRGLVVDARGFAARDALIDLRGVRGEMLMIRARDVRITRPLRLLHPRHPLYLVPRGEGLYMLGATQIESEDRGGVTARGLVDLLNAAYALHPAFAEAEIVETGADLRPAFPDNLPRLRRRGRRLYVNGLFRHGFLLAPACARMLAEVVADPSFIPEIMDEDHRERSPA